MLSRAEIIRAATEKARKNWEGLLSLQQKQLYDLYENYARQTQEVLGKAEVDGKIPTARTNRLMDYVKESIVPFRKSLSGSIKRGISNSVDAALKTQILSLNAGGIANKIIQIGTSFIGKDGTIIRFNAAKETFLQSAWSRMNTQAVQAVMAWKPGGIAFSDRVWEIGWDTQKKLMSIIQTGVMEGKSAATLSREVRKYLVQPETLRGKAKAAAEPGAGVYKSAYKNAMRLTRTELSRAFVEGTYRYAQQKTWIDGYIWRAGSATPCPELCLPNVDHFFTKDNPPGIPIHPHDLCYPELHIQGDPMPGQKGFVKGIAAGVDFGEGGPGSGHFGHAGIPGHLGGSVPGDGGGTVAGKKSPEADWEDPPEPGVGRDPNVKGGMTATGHTNTSIGDMGERLLVKKMGMNSLLPAGKRQNPLDARWDGSKEAYEIKTITTDAKEYKIKMKAHEVESKLAYAKAHGYKAGMIMLIVDTKTKTGYAYKRPGIGNYRLNKEWTFMGKLKLGGTKKEDDE